MRKILLAIIVVFLAWTIMEFIVHRVLLEATYNATADLWRPEEDISLTLVSAVRLVYSIQFVIIYCYLIRSTSVLTGAKYGAIFGVWAGATLGFSIYPYMPIPLSLALWWFVDSVIELTIAGFIVASIINTSNDSHRTR